MSNGSHRPSLLVLLGGTGGWTAVHEKYWLTVDRHWHALGGGTDGQQPEPDGVDPNVVIRAVDVDKEWRPALGEVRLGQAEDLLFEANIGEALEELRRGNDPGPGAFQSIAAWLSPAEAAQLGVSEADRFMTNGAGLVRAFGRMTVFIDALSKHPGLGRLDAGLSKLLHTAAEGQLTIYVIASAAGGTGAGMLLDLLVHLQAARLRLAGERSIKTILFLVLPGAFRGVLDADQFELAQANGLGLLRELDRFLNRADSGPVEIEWRPGERLAVSEPLADTVYLLDGSRDLMEAPQLEGHVPVEDAFAATLSVAIHAHLSPESGRLMASMYRNLQPAWMEGRSRYSTCGSYTVQFDWDRASESFVLRSAEALVGQVLAEPRVDGNALANAFIGGASTDVFMSGGEQEPLPRLLTEVIRANETIRSELAPSTYWLEPQIGTYEFPRVPDLREELPDVRLLHSGYGNDELVEEAEQLMAEFWGLEMDHQVQGATQFHAVARANVDAAEQAFVRALRLATVAVMNQGDGIGAVRAGLDFLESLDRVLEDGGKRLDKALRPEVQRWEQAVKEAKEALSGRSLFGRAGRHGRYLDAEQQLLHQRVADRCLTLSGFLLGRCRHAVSMAQQELAAARDHLAGLEERLGADRRRVDDERHKAESVLSRLVLPRPESPLEGKLYERFAGPAEPSSLLPTKVFQQYRDGLFWHAYERPGQPLGFALQQWAGEAPPRHRDGRPELPTMASLRRLLEPLFTGLRHVSVFEALELEGWEADALVRELRLGGAPLASTRTPNQLKQTPRGVPFQDWTLVFADWRSEGAGSQLSMQVRARLEAEHATLGPVGAAEHSLLPTGDRLVVFTARHLIDLAAFRGVEILTDAYRRRRLETPSPHVFAEEKGAARLEARSEELVDRGLLKAPLGQVAASLVDLCADDHLLKYAAAAMAAGALRWEDTDLVRNEGWWTVRVVDHDLRIGPDRDLGVTLRRIARGRSPSAPTEELRQALEQAGRATLARPDASTLLEAYARIEAPGQAEPTGAVDGLLRTAAAELADQLRSRNLRSVAS
jgi:hypothetical protein